MVRRLVRDYVRPYFGTLGWAILFMLIGAGTTAARNIRNALIFISLSSSGR